ncbi:hypothetical protein BJ138DRAFT_617911 [Hygrophoropsis aurantiaca]|uniref:Uncharacterized protein n=1 Tax=Hygrophoropsis aurantiaca TaxID=72124 RepID=A0ACB7ZZA0_9AGAM|nr:hypothetical protein BJ138DRAFT_617911 [Hygrophoropsis aurantiaca]
MENHKRSPKFGRQWRKSEMDDYNIKIQFQDATTFFNTPVLPPPNVDEELLTTEYDTDTIAHKNSFILTQLDYAMEREDPESAESSISIFAIFLFDALGYAHRPHLTRLLRRLKILICGEYKDAKTNVCIIDRSRDDEGLLVQECRHIGAKRDPYPQVVATAIAAFQTNNSRRIASGLDPLENEIIPAVIMIGSSPTFLKVPVTAELSRCVQSGLYPTTPTVIFAHEPEIPRPAQRRAEGMRPLDNRYIIFQCYEAFKQFVH